MRHAKVRIVVGLLSLTLLAACGRPGDDSDGTPTPRRSGPSAPAPAKARLTMWAMGGDGDNLPKLLKQFEDENPGYSVDVTSIPWQDAASKFRTAEAGGVTPDIAQVGTTLMGGITDGFEPVPDGTDTSVYFSGPLASARVDGRTVGVPWAVDTRVLFYRTDLAEKAGFDGPPKTWDDLKKLARGTQTAGGAKWGIRMATTPDQDLQNSFAFPWSNGAQIISADGSKWTFDTPETIAAYRYYQSFYTEGIADRKPSSGAGAAESAFVNGQLGVLVAGAGESELLDQAGGPQFKDMYALAPFPKQKSATSFAGGSDLVVFKRTRNSAAAWKLVQWLSRPDVQARWYRIDGALPAVRSAWQQPELADDKRLSVFGEQLKDTNAPPANATWLQISDVVGQQLEQMVKNGKDPAKAMKDAQSAADEIGTGG
ncbi:MULTISPECIES: extracellular solute-binding protein [unclassified Streptomyces]|uniref:extracellular solute-binding protein n=1 Tax=unclassified Streptomyces TaxID=2593676 RepID=UPI002E2ABEEA|nr:extracellular solute-binding protein [Streptomyces sp. NBC_00223]